MLLKRLLLTMLALALGAYVNLCACSHLEHGGGGRHGAAPEAPCCPHEQPVAPESDSPASPDVCCCPHGGPVAQPQPETAIVASDGASAGIGLPVSLPAAISHSPSALTGHALRDRVRPPGFPALFLAHRSLLL